MDTQLKLLSLFSIVKYYLHFRLTVTPRHYVIPFHFQTCKNILACITLIIGYLLKPFQLM
jgi:hypothetical protein